MVNGLSFAFVLSSLTTSILMTRKSISYGMSYFTLERTYFLASVWSLHSSVPNSPILLESQHASCRTLNPIALGDKLVLPDLCDGLVLEAYTMHLDEAASHSYG